LHLEEIRVRLVERSEERSYQGLIQAHHYLGALPKIGETIWYVASYHGHWVALLSFSAECVNNFETWVAGSLVSNAALPRVRAAWVLEG
jgi:hypothetical protein